MIGSTINDLKYGHINWGPYVMKTQMPKYIIKKLLVEGKKTKESYKCHS